ncbi:hypothetical protein D3C81_1896020 [compost metagenome]
MFNEKGDYFKIKTITVGYLVPRAVVDRLKIGARLIRFYAMLDNVHTFQRSHVPDAELVSPQGEYSGGAYPLPKKYTIGLEVNF